MSSAAISVKNLGKKYRLGLTHDDLLVNRLLKSLGRVFSKNVAESRCEDIWALRNVSFAVEPGEVLGIIGRNGAGKSTLLKILSRITEPTEGEVEIRGRVASLLEIGTGFHPELTGRENIYLNGSILGMAKDEIDQKLDGIIDFAEIQKFIDTPVKRFSSGMYIRLAFAVAAHLEPEVLVIDEVLAVGDYQFQQKCLGKMKDVSQEGRTVLFVSHNMSAVSQLCTRGILLKDGQISEVGDINKVISAYMAIHRTDTPYVSLIDYDLRSGNGKLRFNSIGIRDTDREYRQDFELGEDIIITFEVAVKVPIDSICFSIILFTSDGIRLCNMIDIDSNVTFKISAATENIEVVLKDVRLYPGTYHISLWGGDVSGFELYDHVNECMSFNIVNGGKLTQRSLPRQSGLLFWTPEWRRERPV